MKVVILRKIRKAKRGKLRHIYYFCVARACKNACWGTPHAGGRGLSRAALSTLAGQPLRGSGTFSALPPWWTAPTLCSPFCRLRLFILSGGFLHFFGLSLQSRPGWGIFAHTGDHGLFRLGCWDLSITSM